MLSLCCSITSVLNKPASFLLYLKMLLLPLFASITSWPNRPLGSPSFLLPLFPSSPPCQIMYFLATTLPYILWFVCLLAACAAVYSRHTVTSAVQTSGESGEPQLHTPHTPPWLTLPSFFLTQPFLPSLSLFLLYCR